MVRHWHRFLRNWSGRTNRWNISYMGWAFSLILAGVKERKVASKNVYSFLSAGLATVTTSSLEYYIFLLECNQPFHTFIFTKLLKWIWSILFSSITSYSLYATATHLTCFQGRDGRLAGWSPFSSTGRRGFDRQEPAVDSERRAWCDPVSMSMCGNSWRRARQDDLPWL